MSQIGGFFNRTPINKGAISISIGEDGTKKVHYNEPEKPVVVPSDASASVGEKDLHQGFSEDRRGSSSLRGSGNIFGATRKNPSSSLQTFGHERNLTQNKDLPKMDSLSLNESSQKRVETVKQQQPQPQPGSSPHTSRTSKPDDVTRSFRQRFNENSQKSKSMHDRPTNPQDESPKKRLDERSAPIFKLDPTKTFREQFDTNDKQNQNHFGNRNQNFNEELDPRSSHARNRPNQQQKYSRNSPRYQESARNQKTSRPTYYQSEKPVGEPSKPRGVRHPNSKSDENFANERMNRNGNKLTHSPPPTSERTIRSQKVSRGYDDHHDLAYDENLDKSPKLNQGPNGRDMLPHFSPIPKSSGTLTETSDNQQGAKEDVYKFTKISRKPQSSDDSRQERSQSSNIKKSQEQVAKLNETFNNPPRQDLDESSKLNQRPNVDGKGLLPHLSPIPKSSGILTETSDNQQGANEDVYNFTRISHKPQSSDDRSWQERSPSSNIKKSPEQIAKPSETFYPGGMNNLDMSEPNQKLVYPRALLSQDNDRVKTSLVHLPHQKSEDDFFVLLGPDQFQEIDETNLRMSDEHFVPQMKAPRTPEKNETEPSKSQFKNSWRTIPEGSFSQVYVTEIINPSELYLVWEINTELNIEIIEYIKRRKTSFARLPRDLLVANEMCLVEIESELKRGVILFAANDECAIQLMDSGQILESISTKELFDMPQELKDLPPLAFQAKLAGMCSLPDKDFEWSENVIKNLTELLSFSDDCPDFSLFAKKLNCVDESLENPVPIELKDDEQNIPSLLLELSPEEVCINRFYFETLRSTPCFVEANEILTFKSFTEFPDVLNLYRPKLLEKIKAILYDALNELQPETDPELGQLVIVKLTSSEDTILYRACVSEASSDLDTIHCDIFDYENQFELTRDTGSNNQKTYLCSQEPGSSVHICKFLPELMKYSCPVYTVRLAGIPDDLASLSQNSFLKAQAQLQDLLSETPGYDEFKIVEVIDQESLPPIVLIRSKYAKNLNAFYFDQLQSIIATETELFQIRSDNIAKSDVSRCSDRPQKSSKQVTVLPYVRDPPELVVSPSYSNEVNIQRTFELEESQAQPEHYSPEFILRPCYQTLDLGSIHTGRVTSRTNSDEADPELELVLFWVITKENQMVLEDIKNRLKPIEALARKEQFRSLLQNLKVKPGHNCLAFNVADEGEIVFERVVVFKTDDNDAHCHFNDSGKEEKMSLDINFLIPLVGNPNLEILSKEVPKKYFEILSTALKGIDKLKPLAFPCKVERESRVATNYYLDTVIDKEFVFKVIGVEMLNDYIDDLLINVIKEQKTQ